MGVGSNACENSTPILTFPLKGKGLYIGNDVSKLMCRSTNQREVRQHPHRHSGAGRNPVRKPDPKDQNSRCFASPYTLDSGLRRNDEWREFAYPEMRHT